jgi:MerR family transcriptional regulator/heat shock protein HspR
MRQLDPRKGLFPIGVAAEVIGVEPRVLRVYEKKGLVTPSRSDGNRRFYSMEDLELLEYVHYMTHVRKVNLAGVVAILELLNKLPEEIRRDAVSSAERAVDQLDQKAKKIFTRGSAVVERDLLDESKPAEIERAAETEADTELDDAGLNGDADEPDEDNA